MKKICWLAPFFAMACEPRIGPATGPTSGAIAVAHDKLLIASEDHGQLLVLDRVSKQIEHRVDVGDTPGHVIVLRDGNAAVSTRYGGSVVIVDIDKGVVVKSIPVGVEPFGMVELAAAKIAVVLAGEEALVVIDVDGAEVVRRVPLPDADPRAVALLPDGTLYVSHMATGALAHVDLNAGTAIRVDITTSTPRRSPRIVADGVDDRQLGPGIVAEHLRSITVDPNTGTVLIAHSRANVDPVRAPIGDSSDSGAEETESCGYSGCQSTSPPPDEGGGTQPVEGTDAPSDLPAVTPSITEVDATGAVLSATRSDDDSTTRSPPSVLDPREQRFREVPIQNPTALALFDGGRGMLVVNLGSKNVLLLRRQLDGTTDDVIARVPVGNGAQSVAVSDDGGRAYIWNQFDLSVSEIDLFKVEAARGARSRFSEKSDVVTITDEPGERPAGASDEPAPARGASTTVLAIEDKLTAEESAGRKLFHDAMDPRISTVGAISCATCHPDGRDDGRTWKFVFGPRNTPQLGGAILDSAPFHWPGDVASVAALNEHTMVAFMGGSGLDADGIDALAAYIDQLRPAPSIASRRGLNESETRGSAIFSNECSMCHAGRHHSDNLAHDIATRADSSDISEFQTPVLHGLLRSAPYLHDGSQPTLEALVENLVRTDQMGHGSELSDADAADLVAYLATL